MKNKVSYPDAHDVEVMMTPGGVCRRIVGSNPGITWFRLSSLLAEAVDAESGDPGIRRVIRTEIYRGWVREDAEHGLHSVPRCLARCPAVEGLNRRCLRPEGHDPDHEIRLRGQAKTITWTGDPE